MQALGSDDIPLMRMVRSGLILDARRRPHHRRGVSLLAPLVR